MIPLADSHGRSQVVLGRVPTVTGTEVVADSFGGRRVLVLLHLIFRLIEVSGRDCREMRS
jgi:hypothetical protein